MATNTTSELLTKSVVIASNLAGKEYHFVKMDATPANQNHVVATADATAVPFLLAEAGDGSTEAVHGTVVLQGVSKLKLGGTVSAGQPITAGAGGVGVASTTDKGLYGAIALENGVSGDVIQVLVSQGSLSA